MKKPIVRLTQQQENEIRRQFFKLKRDPKTVADAHGISIARMRRIVGGSLYQRHRSGSIEECWV